MSAAKNILVIDNYDSFTWNLVHYLEEIGARTQVVRNDELSVDQALARGADLLVIGRPITAAADPGAAAAAIAAEIANGDA